jgi:transcriptional regulator with XRE-family HTH domain
MVTLDEYIKGLKQEIKDKGIKQKELAAILGTSPTRLSLTLSGKEDWRVADLSLTGPKDIHCFDTTIYQILLVYLFVKFLYNL